MHSNPVRKRDRSPARGSVTLDYWLFFATLFFFWTAFFWTAAPQEAERDS